MSNTHSTPEATTAAAADQASGASAHAQTAVFQAWQAHKTWVGIEVDASEDETYQAHQDAESARAEAEAAEQEATLAARCAEWAVEAANAGDAASAWRWSSCAWRHAAQAWRWASDAADGLQV